MPVEFRNLTPHALSIVPMDLGLGCDPVTIPPTGIVARRSVIRRDDAGEGLGDGEHAFHVACESLGPVEGLPEPEDGIVYIVSRIVAEAVPHRRDVVAPGEAVRDSAGRIVGARGLIRCVPATIEVEIAHGCGVPHTGDTENHFGIAYRVVSVLPSGESGLSTKVVLSL